MLVKRSKDLSNSDTPECIVLLGYHSTAAFMSNVEEISALNRAIQIPKHDTIISMSVNRFRFVSAPAVIRNNLEALLNQQNSDNLKSTSEMLYDYNVTNGGRLHIVQEFFVINSESVWQEHGKHLVKVGR